MLQRTKLRAFRVAWFETWKQLLKFKDYIFFGAIVLLHILSDQKYSSRNLKNPRERMNAAI